MGKQQQFKTKDGCLEYKNLIEECNELKCYLNNEKACYTLSCNFYLNGKTHISVI